MPVPINSVFEVQLRYSANGETLRNVFHYYNAAAFVVPTPRDVAIQFAASKLGLVAGHYPFELAAVLANNAVVEEASVQPVYPVRWRRIQASMSINGAQPAMCAAQNLQASITKFGQLADRHSVGGMRIGGLPVNAYSSGLLDAGYKTAVDGLATVLFSAFNLTVSGETVSMAPCIAVRGTVIVGGVPRRAIIGREPIDDWDVQDEVRTQRSRTKGIGE